MANSQSAMTDHPADSMRQAERASLAMRPAKLVCQSGEYLCQLRDVSTLGVGLAFLHDVPPEPRVILQLPNGATHPIERVWIGKRQAGYCFASEIDVADFAPDNGGIERQPLQFAIKAAAHIKFGKVQMPATLIGLSHDGARIICDKSPPLNCLIGFKIGGLAPRLGEMRWKDGNQYGLHFQHALTLDELAQCAAHLQPFKTSLPSGFSGLLSAARAA